MSGITEVERCERRSELVGGLIFERAPDGLRFRMGSDSPVPVSDWTFRSGGMVGGGVLIRLRDDGGAKEEGEHTLMVPWPSVAAMTGSELRCTGLPDAAPFTLEITASGSIPDAGFAIRYGFLRHGRRVPGVQREGAWLRSGGKRYVLLDPLYTIAELTDRFNQADDADIESRMLRWGRIADMLPADVVVNDEHLRSIRIEVASSFELNPFLNKDGEPDFDPVVGRRETRETETGEAEEAFAAALPTARQRDFARYFRGLSRVKHRYPVGGGWYVVLTPDVERALRVVRRAQAGNTAERRDFLMNASARIRSALEDAHGSATDDLAAIGDAIDRVFNDDGLSERVEGVGIWTRKILPWVKLAAEPWLPPEALGVRIGDQIVRLNADELPDLLDRITRAVERGDPTVHIRDGVDVPADPNAIAALEGLVRAIPMVQPPEPDEPTPGPKPDPDRVLLVIDNLEATRFHRLAKKGRLGNDSITPLLRTSLLAHQEEALIWLQRHWNGGSWGALLADDMGLGKTLSALAFLSWLQQIHVSGRGLDACPLLVVAPVGLLRNWMDEHDKHLARLGLGSALEAHGRSLRQLRTHAPSRAQHELATGRPMLDIGVLKKANWVLTTYETLRDHQHSFARVRWRAGVFDEAQKIKNPGVRVTEAVLALNVDFALLMTGTPVENRPADIWSILDRAEPGRFGALKDFSAKYERANGGTSRMEQLHRALTAPAVSAETPTPMAPALMLRRLKEDRIPDLPEKTLHRRVVVMPRLQASEYEKAVLGGRGSSILQALHRLRSISLHPFTPDALDLDSYIQASARLSETFEILGGIAGAGEKALLFVESREMQNFLIGALRRRFQLRDDVLVINGAVSGRTRKARVDAFQMRPGFDVMILSPRAGGVGLTLTAANHVIHLSRWWNPAVEDQCTDRAFRIGQRMAVHVYLPLARHPRFGEYSFDLRLDSLLKRKREMNRRVLAPPAATATEVDELYRSTVTEARSATMATSAATAGGQPESGVNIDLLEPTAFEDWVLRRLAKAGYETRRTPRSGDRGADGLAIHRGGSTPHTIIVQCKQLAPDRKCGVGAVREVLGSIGRYDLVGEVQPMVVTNAIGFTRDARALAGANDVRLVDRRCLHVLQNRPSAKGQ